MCVVYAPLLLSTRILVVLNDFFPCRSSISLDIDHLAFSRDRRARRRASSDPAFRGPTPLREPRRKFAHKARGTAARSPVKERRSEERYI